MVSFPALLSRAGERFDSLLPLAAVPFLLGVLSVDKLHRVADSGADLQLGVTFGLPTTVSTSWDFVNVPSAAPGVNVPTGQVGSTVVVLLVVAVLSAFLGAGYLGGVRRDLADVERDFLGDARTFFGPFLGYELLRLVLVGTVVFSPVALLFDAATMAFVRDLTGRSGGDGTGGQSNMPVET